MQRNTIRKSDPFLTQKRTLLFVAVAVLGIAALLLGLALIIFAHYHERAYIFLGAGAGCFIGGVAGIVGETSKVKMALCYGLIALGMVGISVGLNYMTNMYGPSFHQTRGEAVLIVSMVTILLGIVGALIIQNKDGIAALSSVLMLGMIASLGLVALLIGTVYLVVLEHRGHVYLLLGVGAVCLISGIAYGGFVKIKARATSR